MLIIQTVLKMQYQCRIETCRGWDACTKRGRGHQKGRGGAPEGEGGHRTKKCNSYCGELTWEDEDEENKSNLVPRKMCVSFPPDNICYLEEYIQQFLGFFFLNRKYKNVHCLYCTVCIQYMYMSLQYYIHKRLHYAILYSCLHHKCSTLISINKS